MERLGGKKGRGKWCNYNLKNRRRRQIKKREKQKWHRWCSETLTNGKYCGIRSNGENSKLETGKTHFLLLDHTLFLMQFLLGYDLYNCFSEFAVASLTGTADIFQYSEKKLSRPRQALPSPLHPPSPETINPLSACMNLLRWQLCGVNYQSMAKCAPCLKLIGSTWKL